MADVDEIHASSSAPRCVRRAGWRPPCRRSARVIPSTAWRLFRRNVASEYRQSRLRYVWLVVPMAATAAIWVYLEHRQVVSVRETALPYAVHVLLGLVLWQLFTDCVNAPIQHLEKARPALSKVRLPLETWVVAGALEAAFQFVVRLVPVAAVIAFEDVDVAWTAILVLVAAASLAVLGLALGLLLTPFALLYEDVSRGVTVTLTLWFFLSPVLYERPTEGTGAAIVSWNPVTPALESARAWLIGGPGAEPLALAFVTAVASVVLVLAWLLLRIARPHVVARL